MYYFKTRKSANKQKVMYIWGKLSKWLRCRSKWIRCRCVDTQISKTEHFLKFEPAYCPLAQCIYRLYNFYKERSTNNISFLLFLVYFVTITFVA